MQVEAPGGGTCLDLEVWRPLLVERASCPSARSSLVSVLWTLSLGLRPLVKVSLASVKNPSFGPAFVWCEMFVQSCK